MDAGDRIAALADGTVTIRGIERHWSTVGLYDIKRGSRRSVLATPALRAATELYPQVVATASAKRVCGRSAGRQAGRPERNPAGVGLGISVAGVVADRDLLASESDGQGDLEDAALSGFALDVYAAVESLDGAVHYREAESRATGGAVARGINAVEAFEDALLVLGCDPRTSVAHAKHDVVVSPMKVELDRAAGGGVPECV